MDQMNTLAKPTAHIKYHLKEKKQWFMLTILLLVVSVIVLPILFGDSFSIEFAFLGLTEVCLITLISTLIDFHYLHDAKKFSYFLSKPMNMLEKAKVILASNFIFSFGFIIVITIAAALTGEFTYYLDGFFTGIAFFIVGMFYIALSAHLSGNVFIAGIASVFNFLVPLMILGIIYFLVELVSKVTLGFSSDIIMSEIIAKFIPIDKIYFLDFRHILSLEYLIYLAAEVGILFFLMKVVVKNRKNERIGDHIVFKGYKYFIASMLTFLLPFIVISISPIDSFWLSIFAFIILGALTYYISLIILDKSFKLKKQGVLVYLSFTAASLIVICIIALVTSQIVHYVPADEDIYGIMIADNAYITLPSDEYGSESISRISLKDIEENHIPLYKSPASIGIIKEIHNQILVNNSITAYYDFNIVYFLKDGSKVVRYFETDNYQHTNNTYNEELDMLFDKVMELEDNLAVRFPIVYSNDYRNQFENLAVRVTINDDEMFYLDRAKTVLVFNALRKDINQYAINSKDYVDSFSYNSKHVYFPIIDEPEDYDMRYELEFYSGNRWIKTYRIQHYFTETIQLIENEK